MSGETFDPLAPQRLDKWLWHARFVRSRSDAQHLIGKGRVRVNSQRVTQSAKAVRPGDVLTIGLDRSVRVVKLLASAERRGGAPEAQALYMEEK